MTSPTPSLDRLVPDKQVCRELGITRQTLYVYEADRDLNFPPAIRIHTRKFRSRNMLEEWKTRMLRLAIEQRVKGAA